MTIKIATTEPDHIVKLFEDLSGDEVIRKDNEVDIIFYDIGIERKTASDYISSILDGRLFWECAILKKNFEKRFLIISRNFDYNYLRIHENALIGSMLKVWFGYGIPIFQVKDDKSLVKLCIKLFDYANKKIEIKVVLPDIPEKDRKIKSVRCIKGVGRKIAESLLEGRSVKEVANLNLMELQDIPGIRMLAMNIFDFYNEKD